MGAGRVTGSSSTLPPRRPRRPQTIPRIPLVFDIFIFCLRLLACYRVVTNALEDRPAACRNIPHGSTHWQTVHLCSGEKSSTPNPNLYGLRPPDTTLSTLSDIFACRFLSNATLLQPTTNAANIETSKHQNVEHHRERVGLFVRCATRFLPPGWTERRLVDPARLS